MNLENMTVKELREELKKWQNEKEKENFVKGADISKDYWVDSNGNNHNYVTNLISADAWIKAIEKEIDAKVTQANCTKCIPVFCNCRKNCNISIKLESKPTILPTEEEIKKEHDILRNAIRTYGSKQCKYCITQQEVDATICADSCGADHDNIVEMYISGDINK